jgi:methionyl-tRNA formyltransferase
MLNVHFSLLPRWRGAAPVARALLAGDPMTGVTIIELDEGLDTGPVLTAQAVDIGPDESAGELTTRLARLGARLVNEAIPRYVGGDLESVPQSDEGMTYASKIESGERVLDVAGSTERALNQVRAFSPEPGATLGIDGAIHQILRARPHAVAPVTGTWIEVDGRPVAGFGDGGVELVEIQPPGRRVMDGDAWLRGRHGSSGLVT